MIFPLLTGKLLLAGGLVSCQCCEESGGEEYELAIRYDWQGTGMADLDTKTIFLTEQVGWSCGDSGTYLAWLEGGNGVQDDTSVDGFERVNALVDLARTNGQWTSSVNIELYAGWYTPAAGNGNALVAVTYNGVTQSKTITPGSQNECAASPVGTITVYADGTFDLV
jgi:hypothetical protein